MDADKYRSEFGKALGRQLARRRLRPVDLSLTMGKSASYTSQIMNGHKPVTASLADEIAEVLQADETERAELHHTAARSRGYNIKR